MALVTLQSLPIKEIFPGLRARLVHSDRVTHSWVEVDEGATFPEHRHSNEQIVSVFEGTLELNVEGRRYELSRGSVFVIPPDVPHSGRGLTRCLVHDAFAPVRDDYR